MHLGEHRAEENDEEIFVLSNVFEDVALVVQLPCVDLIENLHEHERVENDGVVLAWAINAMTFWARHETCASCVSAVVGCPAGRARCGFVCAADAVDKEYDDDLVYRRKTDEAVHGRTHDTLGLPSRHAVKELVRWFLGGQGEGGQGVHDQIHPVMPCICM